MTGFRYFLANAFPLYFLLIVLYGLAITSLAFFLSVFFTRARAATGTLSQAESLLPLTLSKSVVGYILVFGSGLFATWLVDTAFSLDSTPEWLKRLLMVYPPFAFWRCEPLCPSERLLSLREC